MQHSNSEVLSRAVLSTSFLPLIGGGKRQWGYHKDDVSRFCFVVLSLLSQPLTSKYFIYLTLTAVGIDMFCYSPCCQVF